MDRGFARLAAEQEAQEGIDIVIFEGQDQCTVNLDETDLSLDHTDGKGYGHKPTAKKDKSLPTGNKIGSKSSDRCTLVTGSNAAGKALPPRVQFKSNAQAHNQ